MPDNFNVKSDGVKPIGNTDTPFRELGPVEAWPEPKPEQSRPAQGMCAPSVFLLNEPEV